MSYVINNNNNNISKWDTLPADKKAYLPSYGSIYSYGNLHNRRIDVELNLEGEGHPLTRVRISADLILKVYQTRNPLMSVEIKGKKYNVLLLSKENNRDLYENIYKWIEQLCSSALSKNKMTQPQFAPEIDLLYKKYVSNNKSFSEVQEDDCLPTLSDYYVFESHFQIIDGSQKVPELVGPNREGKFGNQQLRKYSDAEEEAGIPLEEVLESWNEVEKS